jgi:hypothetical protein
MRRSICYTEPTVALAGERKTWRFVVTPTVLLPKGTRLKFDLLSKGRIVDWEIPNTAMKTGENVIWAEIEGGKILQAKAIETKESPVPQFEFTLPCDVPSGKKITIAMGTPTAKNQAKHGTLSQQTVQRRRPFHLFIDPTGKGAYSDPEVFTLDVKGGELHTIRLLAPSVTVKNRRFDVILRFEDQYGNLTNSAPEDTLIEFTHDNLRESLKWKLFLPETGFIALPNLYFNEPGIYFFKLKNLKTKEEFISSPIKCFATESKNLFWGTLHGESERFDSTENIENCLRHFRDEKSLNFFSTSSPEAIEETSNETWKKISTSISEFDEDDRFTAYIGQQWSGEPKTEGVRIFVFQKDDRPMFRQKDARSSTLKKIYKSLSPKECISIPCFTMGSSLSYNFADFNPDFERVVEIYNAWGCSERSAKDKNPFPISSPQKGGVHEVPEGSIIKALQKNKRFGFVAGGLDDRSIFSAFYDTDQAQYSPGLTAVLSDRLGHQSIFDALYNRACYATTGERIILGVTVAGHLMGSELSTAQKPGLHVNRHIAGYVVGTSKIEKVEIIRNGEVLHLYKPKNQSFDFEYDDMTPLQDVIIKESETKATFIFYYIRVTQSDGHMAWSSPIWVDYTPQPKRPKVVAKPKDVKPVKKALPEKIFDDFNEEDEEEDEDEEDLF